MRATAASSSGVPDCRHTQRCWSEISVHWQGWNVVAGEAGGEGDDGGGGGSGGGDGGGEHGLVHMPHVSRQ